MSKLPVVSGVDCVKARQGWIRCLSAARQPYHDGENYTVRANNRS